MSDSTTIRVSVQTRDSVRDLAAQDGVTMDALLRLLVRRERQRRMGAEDARRGLSSQERAWVDGTAHQAGATADASG